MPGKEKSKRYAKRSNPLGEDLDADRFASNRRELAEDATAADDMDADVTAGFLLPHRTTQRILKTAKEQLAAVSAEEQQQSDRQLNEEEDGGTMFDEGLRDILQANEAGGDGRYFEDESGEAIEIEYDDTESVVSEAPADLTEDVISGNPALYGIDEEEARLLQRFRPTSHVQARNLGDLIMERIKEKEGSLSAQAQAATGAGADSAVDDEEKIDSRVARVYTAIGTVLKRYTSGKIPKAFKILPNIKNWEQLLMLTKPDQWSPHATYQATRIFAANLNERMAQRFYAAVLLPIVHEHMIEEKKLHPSLYMAVRKALFKPIAFFKGFLLPLAMDEECTLREATVVASVLQRSHLPPVPTAVAIVKISQQPFSGPCSVFLRVLIDKKMALPYQAIDALVAYFHRFARTHPKEEPLPVLWHQSLLSFVQRYKADLTMEQLKLLSEVCDVHFHYLITAETRREINATVRAKERGIPITAA